MRQATCRRLCLTVWVWIVVVVATTAIGSTTTVSVSATTLSVALGDGGSSPQRVTVDKTFVLLNGALDIAANTTINTTHVVTTITVGASPLAATTTTASTVLIFTDIINTSLRWDSTTGAPPVTTTTVGSTTTTTTSIPPFLDGSGNPWTMFPTITAYMSLRKADTKVRFQLMHAAIRAYYPVSEYVFEMPLDTTFCNGGPQSAGYKCCQQAQTTTYLVYALATAVEPVTCTINATVAYLDHYHTLEAVHVWDARRMTMGSGGGGAALEERVQMVVSGDVRVAWQGVGGNGSSTMAVARDAGQLPFIGQGDQQLCRKGGFLSNAAQPEPFLVNNWAFGYNARQIGYNASQYVLDRQCNGAPLGYYTSNDGNNSDPFSTWRARTPTSVLVPLTWRNELTTSSATVNGISTPFAETFSMNVASSPAATYRAIFRPEVSSLRPGFHTLMSLACGVAGVRGDAASALVLVHALHLSSSPLWLTPTTPIASPSVTVTATCSVLPTTTSPTSSAVTSQSWTTGTPVAVTTFPFSINWTWTLPTTTTALLGAYGLSCTYRTQRWDINASVLVATSAMASVAALWASVSDAPPASYLVAATILGNTTFVLAYTTVHVALAASLEAFGAPPVQCAGDRYRDAWVAACDDPTAATTMCAARYYGTDRVVYNATLGLCIYGMGSTTGGGGGFNASAATIMGLRLVMGPVYAASVWLQTTPSGVLTTLAAKSGGTSGASLPATTAVYVLPWMSTEDTSASSRIVLQYRSASSTPPPPPYAWIESMALAITQLPFTAKAAVALVFLLVAGLSVGCLAWLWARLRHWLPWRADWKACQHMWTTNVWQRLPSSAAALQWLRSVAGWVGSVAATVRGAIKGALDKFIVCVKRRVNRDDQFGEENHNDDDDGGGAKHALGSAAARVSQWLKGLWTKAPSSAPHSRRSHRSAAASRSPSSSHATGRSKRSSRKPTYQHDQSSLHASSYTSSSRRHHPANDALVESDVEHHRGTMHGGNPYHCATSLPSNHAQQERWQPDAAEEEPVKLLKISSHEPMRYDHRLASSMEGGHWAAHHQPYGHYHATQRNSSGARLQSLSPPESVDLTHHSASAPPPTLEDFDEPPPVVGASSVHRRRGRHSHHHQGGDGRSAAGGVETCVVDIAAQLYDNNDSPSTTQAMGPQPTSGRHHRPHHHQHSSASPPRSADGGGAMDSSRRSAAAFSNASVDYWSSDGCDVGDPPSTRAMALPSHVVYRCSTPPSNSLLNNGGGLLPPRSPSLANNEGMMVDKTPRRSYRQAHKHSPPPAVNASNASIASTVMVASAEPSPSPHRHRVQPYSVHAPPSRLDAALEGGGGWGCMSASAQNDHAGDAGSSAVHQTSASASVEGTTDRGRRGHRHAEHHVALPTHQSSKAELHRSSKGSQSAATGAAGREPFDDAVDARRSKGAMSSAVEHSARHRHDRAAPPYERNDDDTKQRERVSDNPHEHRRRHESDRTGGRRVASRSTPIVSSTALPSINDLVDTAALPGSTSSHSTTRRGRSSLVTNELSEAQSSSYGSRGGGDPGASIEVQQHRANSSHNGSRQHRCG